MGQSPSVDNDDVKHFRKMVSLFFNNTATYVMHMMIQVIHAYYGNLDKLQKHFRRRSIAYQVGLDFDPCCTLSL